MTKVQFVKRQTAIFSLPLLLGAFGCAALETAGRPVSPGALVAVDYTCRLQDGRLAATTLADVAAAEKNTASPVFEAGPGYGRAMMRAEAVPACPECGKQGRFFELVLRENIQNRLPGLSYDEPITLDIRTDELLLDETAGQIRIRRHQTRPKNKPVMLEQVTAYLGRKPEIGEVIDPPSDTDWPVKVLETGAEHVMVEIMPVAGRPWHTPFGPAAFADAGDEYLLTINPETGHLIRSGGLVGRVVNVEADSITLDYRHPFGYEELRCEVTAHEPRENPEAEPGRGGEK